MAEQTPRTPTAAPGEGESAATDPETTSATTSLPEGVELRPDNAPGVERVRVYLAGKPQGAVYRRRGRHGAPVAGRWSILGEERPLYATKEQAALTLLNRARPR